MSACLMSSKVQVTSWCNHLPSDEHAINMHPRNKDHPESSWNHRDQKRFRNQICYLLIRFDLQIYTFRCFPPHSKYWRSGRDPWWPLVLWVHPKMAAYPVDAGTSSHHHWRVTDPHLIHSGPWKIPRRYFLSMLLPRSEKLRFQKEAQRIVFQASMFRCYDSFREGRWLLFPINV